MGDDIQALKAGIMEIADIFLVNKCDRDGVEKLLTILNHYNAISEKDIPIFQTIATTGKGVDELISFILDAVEEKNGKDIAFRRNERIKYRILKIIQEKSVDIVLSKSKNYLDNELKQVYEREKTPYQVADKLMELLCR